MTEQDRDGHGAGQTAPDDAQARAGKSPTEGVHPPGGQRQGETEGEAADGASTEEAMKRATAALGEDDGQR